MFIKRSKQFCLTLMASSLVLATGAHASGWADKTTISGFSSATYQISDNSTPFNGDHDNGISSQGSFRGTRFGININSQINDKISLASQLISSKDHDNYGTRMDWVFITYQATDEISIRTGKIKYPVGIANEYVSVGYAYPWISPPQTFYSTSTQGPQVTRDAYTGASFLWQKDIGDISYSADLYGGEVELGNMVVHELRGITVSANWNDIVLIQASSYQGKMENEQMAAMDGERHAANVIGLKLDLENIIAYAEYAKVDMGNFEAGNSDSWYGSMGYRLGDFLPYASFGGYERGKGAMVMQSGSMINAYNKQYIASAGIKYDILPSTDIKLEYSKIHTSAGKGLYAESSADADVNIVGVAIDVVF